MIIGVDGSRAFGLQKTGTENYSFAVLTHLAKIDHKNSYIIYLRPGAVFGTGWPSNFHFKVLPFPRLWTQAGLAKQTFVDRVDVLFIPSHTLPLLRRPGLKTVLTVHDLGAEYLPKAHQLKQRLYLKLMTHYQLQSASHLIAVSEATKQDLINKIGIKAKDITVIYEGYNEKLKKNDSKVNILKQYDIEKRKYFLFVGTIQPRKNIERLIKSYAQYLKTLKGSAKDHPWLLLAGGKGWLSDDLYKLPQALGIEDQVRFLGYVPDEHLPSLYKGAQAFLFPSLFEGFGLPVLEAFACDCPVLTSNTSSLPEVAGHAAILVDPYSVDSIAEGIKTISTPDVQERLIRAGRVQLKKFSWKQAAIKTRAVLEKTLSVSSSK